MTCRWRQTRPAAGPRAKKFAKDLDGALADFSRVVSKRAKLVERLLASLDALLQEEHDALCSAPALRRDAELDKNPPYGSPGRGRVRGRFSSPPRMRVVCHPLAETELNEAAQHFLERDHPALAKRPILEAQRASTMVAELPGGGRLLPGGVRSWHVRVLPCSRRRSADTCDSTRSRTANYWKSRG